MRKKYLRPSVRVPHLASFIFGKALRRVKYDWKNRYGTEPLLVETFVDTRRKNGLARTAQLSIRNKNVDLIKPKRIDGKPFLVFLVSSKHASSIFRLQACLAGSVIRQGCRNGYAGCVSWWGRGYVFGQLVNAGMAETKQNYERSYMPSIYWNLQSRICDNV